MSVNAFSAKSKEEFIRLHTATPVGPMQPAAKWESSELDDATSYLHENFNWQSHATALPPIRNQGQSNCCWAFSTIASIESAYRIKTQREKDFSVQQVVDCSPRGFVLGIVNRFTDGTGPGRFEAAFDYFKENALNTEENYPFIGGAHKCREGGQLVLKGSEVIGSGIFSQEDQNVEKIMDMVKRGVVSTYIHVGDEIQHYSGGIITHCGGGMINHEVNIVGYGFTHDSIPYWIVRNSWGDYWGEQGYFRIVRGRSMCGIGWRVGRPIL